jgi:transcriptional antiterminator RfaH
MLISTKIKNATSSSFTAVGLQWYVIYTKSRNEKKVAFKLISMGIEAYCPLKVEMRVWSDRRKRVETPLFNSYLFVKLQEKDLPKVFEVAGVVRYVYWCGKPAIVKDEEIMELKRWLNDYDHDALEIKYFEENQKVKILSGNFMDCDATVVKQKGLRLELCITGLGMSLVTKTNRIVLNG